MPIQKLGDSRARDYLAIAAAESDELLRWLGSEPNGLDGQQAASRVEKRSRQRRSSPWPHYLKSSFANDLAILLWIAAVLAAILHQLDPSQGMDRLSVAVLAVVLVNGLFGLIQEFRVERALEELRLLMPASQTVVRGGDQQVISLDEIVPGDILVLREGDHVPADARVIHSEGLTINLAPLTGESEPQLLEDVSKKVSLSLDARNIAFAGCTVLAGHGLAVAFRVGKDTEIGRIGALVAEVHEESSPLLKQLDRTSHRIAFVALTIGFMALIVSTLLGQSVFSGIVFCIGICVALVPEGLPPTVSMALAFVSRDLARRNALVKQLTGVETLGSVTYICTDKTGTLTQNRMTVHSVTQGGDILRFPTPDGEAQQQLWSAAVACNNADVAPDGIGLLGDPTEVALLEAAQEFFGTLPGMSRIREVPFTPERRRMSVIAQYAGLSMAFVKGAPEAVLPRCAGWPGTGTPWINAERAEMEQLAEKLAGQGLRVLAFACRPVDLPADSTDIDIEQELGFLGFVGLLDPPRPEVPGAIAQCLAAGVRICVLTGDHPATAAAIARDVGLGDADVFDAEEFFASPISDRQTLFAARRNVVLARFSPEAKLNVVRFLIDAGEIVAVTGDGVNDTPALKQAHLGVAMGRTGTPAAREAADIVLLDDSFETIVVAIAEGRRVFANVRKFLTYVLTSNVAELVPFVAFILLQIPLPLLIIQILAIDLGTDLLPAMALGVEPGTESQVRQPPRPPSEPLFDRFTVWRSLTFLGVIEAAAGMGAYAFYLWQTGWSFAVSEHWAIGHYQEATTMCLAAIIWTQVFNVFVCRSSERPVWRIPFFGNRFIFGAVAIELLLLVLLVYAPSFHFLFETAALPLGYFLIGIFGGLVLLVADGARALLWPRPE